MKREFLIFVFAMCCLLGYAQEPAIEIREEESAEVSLEDYTDDFQENFFEALKQKSIENYDRAINLFLECKSLNPEILVVDHELAKVYAKDKQYPLAEDYAITTVKAEPENLWYLKTLVDIVQVQHETFNSVLSGIPYENAKLKENLALIYYQEGNYTAAQNVLKDVPTSSFSKALAVKVNDSMEDQRNQFTKATVTKDDNSDLKEEGSLTSYQARIQKLLTSNNSTRLLQLSEEALESYPSQPYFYYANGYALNQQGKRQEAIEILETALDYMLGDISLTNKIYKELSIAYMATGNTVKANMYLSKIKPGF